MSRSKKKYIPEFFVVSKMYWLKQPNQSLVGHPTKDVYKPWLRRTDTHVQFVVRSLSPLMFLGECDAHTEWKHDPIEKVLEFFSLTHNRNIFVRADQCVHLKQMHGQYERLPEDAAKETNSE